MSNENVVFFIGAGFSWDADMPTMKEFAISSEHEFIKTKEYAFANPSYRFLAPLIYEAGIMYRAFKKYCKDILKENNTNNINNLEWLFRQAEEVDLKEIEMQLEFPNGQDYCNFIVSKSELKIALQFWVWKIYNRLPILGDEKVKYFLRKPAPELYENFCKILKDSNNNISIITTNYDLVIEYSFWKYSKGAEVHYPMNYVAIPMDENSEQFINDNESGIPIYKIHGSVNYYTKNNKIDTLYVSCDLAIRPLGNSNITGEPATIHYDGLLGLRYKHGSDLVPEIVPPSKKFYVSDGTTELPKWQKQIISKANKKLRNADKVIFIGYSLPGTDEHIKEWLKTNTRPEAKIVVVNSDKECEINYNDVYDKFQFVHKPFFNALEDIQSCLL